MAVGPAAPCRGDVGAKGAAGDAEAIHHTVIVVAKDDLS
jgi:hypothetical protein